MLPDSILPTPEDDIARIIKNFEKRLTHLEILEGGGALTLIEDVLLTAPQATIDFQNIPAIYKHLKVVAYLRASNAVEVATWEVRFNNDSGNNYTTGYVAHNAGGTHFPVFIGATDGIISGFLPGASADAFLFSANEFEIPNYANADNYKTLRATCVHIHDNVNSSDMFLWFGGGAWRDAAAINRVTVLDTGGGFNFVAGSRVSLYGKA